MAKRRAGSQTTTLTPDQKKSGIDPIYVAADDVRHTIGKLSTRATTLLQTAPQFKVCSQSYGLSTGTISGLPHGSLGREKPFGCSPRGEVQSIL